MGAVIKYLPNEQAVYWQEDREQYNQRVDHPELLEGAIEKFLRFDPAVIAFRRTAMQDVEVV